MTHFAPLSEKQQIEKAAEDFFQGNKPPFAPLKSSQVPQDESGCEKLADAGSWKDVASLAATLLQRDGLKPSETLRLKTMLCTSHIKLERFKEAANLIEKIGPLFGPDKLYSSYPDIYPEKTGSMVPLNLHLLAAELPSYQGDVGTTIDNLCKTVDLLEDYISFQEKKQSERDSVFYDPSVSVSLLRAQRKSVLLRVVNFHLLCKPVSGHQTGIELLQMLIREEPTDPNLYSFLGRLYLQIGDVMMGEKVLKEADRQGLTPLESTLNRSLIHLGHLDYQEAFEELRPALSQRNVPCAVVNNFAVCALYCNKLDQAVQSLERLVRENPTKNLTPTVLSNLQILYDLSSSNSKFDKRVLDEIVSFYASDTLRAVLDRSKESDA